MKLNITGPDLIALVLLVGAFILRGLGVNSITEYIIISIAVAYGLISVRNHLPKKEEGETNGQTRGDAPTSHR